MKNRIWDESIPQPKNPDQWYLRLLLQGHRMFLAAVNSNGSYICSLAIWDGVSPYNENTGGAKNMLEVLGYETKSSNWDSAGRWLGFREDAE